MDRYQRKFKALGSDIILTLVDDRGIEEIDLILDQLVDKINLFEVNFSRFIETSELSIFNSKAGNKVNISKDFKNILTESLKYSKITKGVFNPFILPDLYRAGYQKSFIENANFPLIDYSGQKLYKIDELVIGDDWALIPINSAIDLGGIGKGYLLDQLNAYLQPLKLNGYFLSLGGDLICFGKDIENKAWDIGVGDALRVDQIIKSVFNETFETLAIATSGITKRKGVHNGKAWNHIIDPSTSKPSQTSILSVTTWSDSATTADVIAKTILIKGELVAKQFIANGYIKNYLIQKPNN